MNEEQINNVESEKIRFFSDDEKILFSKDDIEIYYDDKYKVRVKSKPSCTDRIIKAKEIVMQINNLPMSKRMRKNYGKEIANIYQIAYNSDIQGADQFGKQLLKLIENNIIVYKKIEFIIPSLILVLLSILVANNYSNIEYKNAFIYGPLGGLLAIIINQQNLNIDFKVDRYILIIESLKRIIISIIVSIIGIIAIKSQFLFSSINFSENIYMEYLVLILCGYSQTFIPNLLDKLSTDMGQA